MKFTCYINMPERMVVIGVHVGVVHMQRTTGRGKAGHRHPFASIEVSLPDADRGSTRSILVVPVNNHVDCYQFEHDIVVVVLGSHLKLSSGSKR